MATVLEDVLKKDLKVVICGTAARHEFRLRSLLCRWAQPVLAHSHDIGLTPRQLQPHEFHLLTEYGIGLTDLAQHTSGPDRGLNDSDFDVPGFRQRMAEYSPKVIAFNGKEAARIFYGLRRRRDVTYGHQKHGLGEIDIFALPSTSGKNGHWTGSDHVSYWTALTRYVKALG